MSHLYLKNVISHIVLDDIYKTIIIQVYDFTWQNEEVIAFINTFFQSMESAQLIETIEGADKLSSRFNYQQQEFILNIECVCESIWIEYYNYNEEDKLRTLYQAITALLPQGSK